MFFFLVCSSAGILHGEEVVLMRDGNDEPVAEGLEPRDLGLKAPDLGSPPALV